MIFLMSNGAPACFAETREEAVEILGTAEIQEIPHRDLTGRDWRAAEAAVLASACSPWALDDWLAKVETCFAVAC